MSAMAEARVTVERTERLFVDWHRFASDDWRGLRLRDHYFYLGAAKAWWDQCCNRQICDLSLAPYPELSLISPYLRACQRGIEERTRPIDHPALLARRPPLYFDEPVESDDLVYVDLDRAYWSIYTRTTLDVAYDGDSAPRRGHVEFLDADELGRHKLMRNGLLGLQHRTFRRGLDHGQPFREVVPSWRRRPDLWGLVMDAMTVLMWSARRAGAVYVHTDGAIFTSSGQATEWIDQLDQTYRITGSVRAEGPGFVRGLGRFRIGEQQAGRDVSRFGRVDSMRLLGDSLATALTEWLCYSRKEQVHQPREQNNGIS